MKTFLLIALLFIPATAQAPLKPISFALSVDPAEGPFTETLWHELRHNRNLMLASRKPDFDIYVVMTPLKEEERFYGYAAAVLVVTAGEYKLSIHTGRGPEPLARHLAATLQNKYLTNSPPERVK
jgi:hypothetical protein